MGKENNNRTLLIEHFINKCSMAIEEANRVAELNGKLEKKMRSEIVAFKFRKVDGTIRIARGTLRSDIMPEIKGTGRPLSFELQLFFDMDKQSFRSFKKSNLISIEKYD